MFFSWNRNLEKETETKDQNNKLDKKESQQAVNNVIEDSCTNKEKQLTTKSSGKQDVPCNIKGVLVHVQLCVGACTCLPVCLECVVYAHVIANPIILQVNVLYKKSQLFNYVYHCNDQSNVHLIL